MHIVIKMKDIGRKNNQAGADLEFATKLHRELELLVESINKETGANFLVKSAAWEED